MPDTITIAECPTAITPKLLHIPIVSIGFSACGLKSLEEFLKHLPADTGMAYVIIQHPEDDHQPPLQDTLTCHTTMHVRLVKMATTIKPNTVFVIPQGYDPALLKGQLQIIRAITSGSKARPLDFFLQAIAVDLGSRATCILLSGKGTDGSKGIHAIKNNGGIVIAQRPESAQSDSMPANAINTGNVDLILEPSGMGSHLAVIASCRYQPSKKNTPETEPDTADYLHTIFALIKNQTGHDFSDYKETVITRRTQRRMQLHHIDHISHYVQFLQRSSNELDALFRDLLIGVTSFFRNPESFAILRDRVLRPLLKKHKLDRPIRIWVIGCATGEEAYTIAMLICEEIERLGQHPKVQIFATDIDRQAILFARQGIYPETALENVSEKRRHRFFSRQGKSYQVNKDLRDMVLFADHNIIRDAPFSNIDIISCRNLLIYMNAKLHSILFPLFYHSLSKNGHILLGNAESIGALVEYFTPVSRKRPLFQRQADVSRRYTPWLPDRSRPNQVPYVHEYKKQQLSTAKPFTYTSFQKLCVETLLDKFCPAAALIQKNHTVLYTHGQINDFLQIPTGETQYNISSLVIPEIKIPLDRALIVCSSNWQPVKRSNISCEINKKPGLIDLHLVPVGKKQDEYLMLVVFEKKNQPKNPVVHWPQESGPAATKQKIENLEQELNSAHDQIASLVEKAAITELESKSIHEELKSTNQELQAVNEEQATSQEELQSTSEELVTVNRELTQRIQDLGELNNDMVNLLAATDIGTLFLDPELKIMRFTPAISRVINLRPADEGRPLADFNIQLRYDTLIDDVHKVLSSLSPLAKEVRSLATDHRWYMVQIVPYRTIHGVVQGVVISFIDITWRRNTDREIKNSRLELEQIFNSAADGMIVILLDYSVLRINDTFIQMTGKSREECMNKSCWELFPGSSCHKKTCRLGKISNGEAVVNENVELTRTDGNTLTVALTSIPYIDANGKIIGAIMCLRDITEILKKEQQYLSIFDNAADAILWIDTTTGQFIRSNKAAEEMLGWTQEELTGMKQTTIYPPKERAQYYKIFTIEQAKTTFKDYRNLITKDGKIVPTSVHSSYHIFDGLQVIQEIYHDLSTEQELQMQITHHQKIAS